MHSGINDAFKARSSHLVHSQFFFAKNLENKQEIGGHVATNRHLASCIMNRFTNNNKKKNSSVTVVSEDKNCQICFGCHHNVHFIGDIKQVPIA